MKDYFGTYWQAELAKLHIVDEIERFQKQKLTREQLERRIKNHVLRACQRMTAGTLHAVYQRASSGRGPGKN